MSIFGSSPKQPALPPVPEPPKVPDKDEIDEGVNMAAKRRKGAVGRKETILSPAKEEKKAVLGG